MLHAGRWFALGLRMRRLFGIPFQGSGWTGGEGAWRLLGGSAGGEEAWGRGWCAVQAWESVPGGMRGLSSFAFFYKIQSSVVLLMGIGGHLMTRGTLLVLLVVMP